jgi:small-conductance mechanosensitive channel
LQLCVHAYSFTDDRSMNQLVLNGVTLPAMPVALACVLLFLCLLLVIKRFILVRLTLLSERSNRYHSTLLLRSSNWPLTILIAGASLFLLEYLLRQSGLEEGALNSHAAMVARILLVIATVIFVDSFAVGLLRLRAERSEAMRTSRGIIVGIARGIARGITLGVGMLVIMGTLGISITPIIASLGITSLAVALALQPTLSNFFSGVQLVMDKPIRVGDFVELDSGEQGIVEKIGWRSTWIKMLPNNIVIMPNSLLSESKIINYFYPTKELSVPVEVRVHYDSDLEHVEQITLEVARETLRTHEWGVEDYETFVVYHTFDSSSVNFTVMLRAGEYFQRFWVKSAFIKALHQRYAQEGIVIPYPISALNSSQEQMLLSSRPASGESAIHKHIISGDRS